VGSRGGDVLIIAEIGSVHDGSYGNARQLVATAAACGADAVKFQTHIAAAETLPDAPMPSFFQGEPRYEYFERTGFRPEQWQGLRDACAEQGVEFLSSPFSVEAVALLESVAVERYKVPSGEVTNVPLLEAVADTGKPVILSSGMSSWDELDRAVEVVRARNGDLTVLQCTSEYPCAYEHVGLNVMTEMASRYGAPVGLSDHTLSIYAPVAAVTLGARVIEKHLTFSRRMYGSDARHSLEPDEFAAMVEGIRATELMVGTKVDKSDTSPFTEMKQVFEKSIVTNVGIPAGATITREMLAVKKPGTGLPPAKLSEVVGRKAADDIAAGELLSERHLV
jgi:N-acetylneuraminate synthase